MRFFILILIQITFDTLLWRLGELLLVELNSGDAAVDGELIVQCLTILLHDVFELFGADI